MKNITVCQRAIGVLAIIIAALVGMLLVQQLASASGNYVEMEIIQRDYDWGESKPAGQHAEDAHRSNLDENFRVEASQQGQLMAFKVSVPGDLITDVIHNATVYSTRSVHYTIENAFHKYVDSKEDCNDQRTDDATQMTLPGDQAKIVDMHADLTTMNEGQYSCLVVKLKGAISRSPDTHPQWAFVSPVQITQMANWPDISVVQEEETITAYSLAGASGLRFHFKYRILDEGNQCNESAFAVAPNHPAVHRSNQFNIPDSPEARAHYNNRYVCFQATIINIDHDAYARGASVYRYGAMRIDL